MAPLSTTSQFFNFILSLYHNKTMPRQNNEAQLLLALQALKTTQKLSIRQAALVYNVPRRTLTRRLAGIQPILGKRDSQRPLTEFEEEELVQYILDLDSRGFPPRIECVRDMANLLRATRRADPVGKNWPYRFVRDQPMLRTRFSRVYDFQRALCEDPELIGKWFELVANMRAKYGIPDSDLYNFDETGFMMGVISSSMVVTSSERKGRTKQLQAGNREWATAIECISADGFVLPPFLILQGKYHLASWYTETGLPSTWKIKTTANGWTDNQTSLEWIKHFNEHTLVRRVGAWRMLILDGHESHLSVEFEAYCAENNIITLCLPSHSSHLTQPLDVGCYSVLKRMYSRELEVFIKASITHITKVEFLLAFKAAHDNTMTAANAQAGFRGTGLVPYDPKAVLSKLDIKLRTPTPTGPPRPEADSWTSQTPHNATEAISQSELVRNRIDNHQGSSPTSLFAAVKQLAKGNDRLAHQMTLLTEEVRNLRQANEALSKRRRAKRTRVQDGGSLTVEDAQALIAEKEAMRSKRQKRSGEEGRMEAGPSTLRRCGNCGAVGHNVRTCGEVEEGSDEGSYVGSDGFSCIVVE